jgi:hypothetical protein
VLTNKLRLLSETRGIFKLVRDDEAFQRDLARWRAEAESGDALSVVDTILDDISEDLNTSIVDNSARIARVDALLGLSDSPASNNGTH